MNRVDPLFAPGCSCPAVKARTPQFGRVFGDVAGSGFPPLLRASVSCAGSGPPPAQMKGTLHFQDGTSPPTRQIPSGQAPTARPEKSLFLVVPVSSLFAQYHCISEPAATSAWLRGTQGQPPDLKDESSGERVGRRR